MVGMIVLRKRYALVFGSFDMRKPFQGMNHPRDYVTEKGMPVKLGRCVTTQKGVTRFPKGLCSREWKVGE